MCEHAVHMPLFACALKSSSLDCERSYLPHALFVCFLKGKLQGRDVDTSGLCCLCEQMVTHATGGCGGCLARIVDGPFSVCVCACDFSAGLRALQPNGM